MTARINRNEKRNVAFSLVVDTLKVVFQGYFTMDRLMYLVANWMSAYYRECDFEWGSICCHAEVKRACQVEKVSRCINLIGATPTGCISNTNDAIW